MTAISLGVLVLLAVSPELVVGRYYQREALNQARIATIGYCGAPKFSRASVESLDCGPACDEVSRRIKDVHQLSSEEDSAAHALVMKWGRQCYVTFRGSADFASLMRDAEAVALDDFNKTGVDCSWDGAPCQVGRGFLSTYMSLAEAVRAKLGELRCGPNQGKVAVTGHSLGGAMAMIAMYDLHSRGYRMAPSYTFGQPRTGNRAFAEKFSQVFGYGHWLYFRVTHREDPVPHWPPGSYIPGLDTGYHHAANEVFYNGTTTEGFLVCNDVAGEDWNCASQYWNIPKLMMHCAQAGFGCDHFHYMQPLKKTRMASDVCHGDSGIPDTIPSNSVSTLV